MFTRKPIIHSEWVMTRVQFVQNRYFTLFTMIFLLFYHAAYSQDEKALSEDPASQSSSADESPLSSTEDNQDTTTRVTPNIDDRQAELLRAQYPKEDLRKLMADGVSFSALWRKDRSGEAYGALLIVPADGQTANWPDTIDILRNDLPQNGWSTLSIDIISGKNKPIPPRSDTNKSESNDEAIARLQANSARKDLSDNHARILAAVDFLHNEGQYNIILMGYGNSAERVIDFASSKNKPARTSKNNKVNQILRALMIVNGRGIDGNHLSPSIGQLNEGEMPILDVVFSNYHLDLSDAEERKMQARSARLRRYFQIKLLAPTSTVFAKENRLSRRVRGFLNKHAKGIEINKR